MYLEHGVKGLVQEVGKQLRCDIVNNGAFGFVVDSIWLLLCSLIWHWNYL